MDAIKPVARSEKKKKKKIVLEFQLLGLIEAVWAQQKENDRDANEMSREVIILKSIMTHFHGKVAACLARISCVVCADGGKR